MSTSGSSSNCSGSNSSRTPEESGNGHSISFPLQEKNIVSSTQKNTNEHLIYYSSIYIRNYCLGKLGSKAKNKDFEEEKIEKNEENEDQERERVRNILEYKRIKNAVGQFEKLERNRAEHFTRGKFDDQKELEVESEHYDMQMTVYELVVVFNDIFEKKKKEEIFHIVEPEPYTVEEKMDDILELINTQKKISFLEYLRNIGDVLTVVINFMDNIYM